MKMERKTNEQRKKSLNIIGNCKAAHWTHAFISDLIGKRLPIWSIRSNCVAFSQLFDFILRVLFFLYFDSDDVIQLQYTQFIHSHTHAHTELCVG